MKTSEQGFILITILILLCVLTLIVANSFEHAVVQLKMSQQQIKEIRQVHAYTNKV